MLCLIAGKLFCYQSIKQWPNTSLTVRQSMVQRKIVRSINFVVQYAWELLQGRSKPLETRGHRLLGSSWKPEEDLLDWSLYLKTRKCFTYLQRHDCFQLLCVHGLTFWGKKLGGGGGGMGSLSPSPCRVMPSYVSWARPPWLVSKGLGSLYSILNIKVHLII